MTSKKQMRKNYNEAKRRGYLTKADMEEAYALGVISEKEYNRRMHSFGKRAKYAHHALSS